jgi:UDP:flavonoid glycosyltransferase YjiC (YdhE family)
VKVLFVVPPLVGHVNPTVSIAAALAARGHEVVWAGHPERIAALLPSGARLLSLGELPGGVAASIAERSRSLRGIESLQFLYQDFLVPLARAMAPSVEAAARELRPDVMVVDQQAFGGALAARRLGVPWVTLCTTTGMLVDPLAPFPKVKEWIAAQLADLEEGAGLDVLPSGDLSPRLALALSTPALAGAREYPPQLVFVGPAIAGRPDATPFPWEALRPGRRVLVSLGTVSAERGAPFFAAAIAGIRAAQLVVVAPPGVVPDPPPHVLVRARVPQLQLLSHVDAVVTHGGHNTVCEALSLGKPLVCAPIRDDQPVVAQQVVAAGAGLRVRFGHPSAATLGAVVARVLDEPSFAAAAERIAASFREAGGAARAADEIARVAT